MDGNSGNRGTGRRRAGWTAACAASALLALAGAAGAIVAKPKAVTGTVTAIHGTSGELTGVVKPAEQEVTYFFQYGSTVKGVFPAQTKPVTLPKGTNPFKVGQTVNGLVPKELYRLVVTWVAAGKTETAVGREREFSGGKARTLRFVIEHGKEERRVIRYGETLDFTGSLAGTGNAGMTLSLQSTPFPYTQPFTTLAGTVQAGRTGQFLFKVAGVHENTQFRVFTNTTRPLYSHPVTVSVAPRVTLHVRKVGAGRYRFYGTVAPLMRNAVVMIQQLRPGRAASKKEGPQPHRVGSARLRRASSTQSSFAVTLSLSGNYHYQAFVALSRGPLISGASNHVLVKAPAATTKHPRRRKKK